MDFFFRILAHFVMDVGWKPLFKKIEQGGHLEYRCLVVAVVVVVGTAFLGKFPLIMLHFNRILQFDVFVSFAHALSYKFLLPKVIAQHCWLKLHSSVPVLYTIYVCTMYSLCLSL